MQHILKTGNAILPGLLAAAFAAASGHASAAEFSTDSGWNGSFNNTISLSSAWRAGNPDGALYTPADGARMGLTDGTAGNPNDAGNLNYRKNDRISTIAKLISEFEIKRDDAGALVRAKFWYDQAANSRKVLYGNMANNYTKNATLSDSGFEDLQKFSGAYLLDAYIYDTFRIGANPLQLRLGRQVVNWGESLFVQGVNQINPVDLSALRRPGAELKEALLPVAMLNANLGLSGGHSLEAFYQFKWDNTSLDSCGTYWAVTDAVISTRPGACKALPLVPLGGISGPSAYAAGMYVPMVEGRKASNAGQFGVAYRFPLAALDTEIGMYAMKIHSRTPIVSGLAGTNLKAINPAIPLLMPLAGFAGVPALNPAVNPNIKPMKAFWEYPEDVRLFGLSASTNLGGWSLGSELSYSPNVPVQRNGNDVIAAALLGAGPMGKQAQAAVAKGVGTYLAGYDRFHKTQLQLNGVSTYANVLGAQQAVLVGEIAGQWNNVPDYKNDVGALRYGRAFQFGQGSHALYGGSTCGPTTAINNPSPEGCKNDGYVSRNAWGLRVRGQLEYSNAFDSGVTVYPSAFLAADIKGYSMDGQFIEDRRQLGLGVRLSYQKKHNLEFTLTTFDRSARYDPLRDHGFYAVNYSTTF
jgi:hypothetical protein